MKAHQVEGKLDVNTPWTTAFLGLDVIFRSNFGHVRTEGDLMHLHKLVQGMLVDEDSAVALQKFSELFVY